MSIERDLVKYLLRKAVGSKLRAGRRRERAVPKRFPVMDLLDFRAMEAEQKAAARKALKEKRSAAVRKKMLQHLLSDPQVLDQYYQEWVAHPHGRRSWLSFAQFVSHRLEELKQPPED